MVVCCKEMGAVATHEQLPLLCTLAKAIELCVHKWGLHFTNTGCRTSLLTHPASWGHIQCARHLHMYVHLCGGESVWV